MCRFAAPGYLVYRQANSLMAAPFDPLKVEITGPAVEVAEDVMPAQYNISASGSLVYLPGSGAEESSLLMVDRKGVASPLTAPTRNYQELRMSPDNSRFALTISGESSDVWIYDLQRETLTRLTFEGAQNPVWTPDGKRLTYVSRRNGTRKVFLKNADGSGAEQEIMKGEVQPVSWSPDGKYLVYNELSQISRSQDIWIFSTEQKKAEPFAQTPFREVGGYFSPDGHFLAYSSQESGGSQVYVQAFPGGGGKWQISTDGGNGPRWNPNGRELFYIDDDNKLMSVEVNTSPSFSAAKPRKLFEATFVNREFSDYEPGPDGQHFIALAANKKETVTPQINLVLNWFEDLKRRVPTGSK